MEICLDLNLAKICSLSSHITLPRGNLLIMYIAAYIVSAVGLALGPFRLLVEMLTGLS
jgi:hypothetical protein